MRHLCILDAIALSTDGKPHIAKHIEVAEYVK